MPKKKMEPVKQEPEMKSRSPKEINDEYTTLCTAAGDRYFKKLGLEQELSALQTRVKQLGEELAKAQAEAPKPAEEAKEA